MTQLHDSLELIESRLPESQKSLADLVLEKETTVPHDVTPTDRVAPRTEAGRALTTLMRESGYRELPSRALDLIAAIEAEARQQVVEQIRERLRPPPHVIGYSVIVALLDELGEAHRGD